MKKQLSWRGRHPSVPADRLGPDPSGSGISWPPRWWPLHGGRFTRRLLLVGVLALALFGPGFVELVRLSLMQRRLDRQLAQLTAEQARLVRKQDRLRNDPTYVEGLIRSTFKWAKKGETVILIGDEVMDAVAR